GVVRSAGRGQGALPGVDELDLESGGEQGGRGGPRARGGAGGIVGRGGGLRADADLHAVGLADPQRCGRAADPAGGALAGARVGGVVGVVGLVVVPVGRGCGPDRRGAGRDPAAGLGAGVVPDDPEEGEVPYGARAETLDGGAGGAVAAERTEGQGLGAAGDAGLGRPRRARGRFSRRRRSRGRRGGGRGEGEGEGGG